MSVEAIPVTRLEKELHPAALIVRFGSSAARLEDLRKPNAPGVRIEPALDGVWRWNNDRCLAFRPARDWPADTKFRVVFDKQFFPRHVLLDHYEIETKTPDFVATMKSLEFYQNPQEPAVKQVVATLEFTHSVDSSELQKHFRLAMLGGAEVWKSKTEPSFSITYGLHHRVAYLRTSTLVMPEREDFMRVTLVKGVKTTQGSAATKTDVEKKVKLPTAESFFRIESVKAEVVQNSKNESEQVLTVSTTGAAVSADVAKNLRVFLLPKKPVPSGEDPDDDKAAWQSASEIDETVLKTAKPVSAKLVSSDPADYKEHTFKIKVETAGQLFVRIDKALRAPGGYSLHEDYTDVLAVPELPKQIVIEGKGGVLALNGERKLAIQSRGVGVIEYEIARVPADQINHLVSQTEGNFENPEFVNRHFNETNIARIATEKQTLNLTNKYQPNYSAFDFSKHLQPAKDGGSALQGLFFLKAREWHPPKEKKTTADDSDSTDDEEENDTSGPSDSRFVLVTDLGMIVKQNGDESRDVFIASIKTGAPLAAVSVDVLGKNGVPLFTGKTSTDGRVTFPSLGKPTREKEPVALVARFGADVAFMPFKREDRQLDFSRFDIGGIERKSGAELDAFVFTERGIYRPGDEIHAAVIVKQADWRGGLAGIPIEVETVDARSQSVQCKKLTLPESGFVEWSYATAYESPSGAYELNVFLTRDGKRDTLLGSASVQVKEFLPDGMRITSHLTKEAKRGWITPEEVSAEITLQNLYGTPAADHRIAAKLQLSPARFRFEEYKDYTFFDRLRETNSEVKNQSVDLGDTQTDDLGVATFDLGLEQYADATYEAWFCAEGFEADGGRSVSAANSVLVSAQPWVIGWKPDGDFKYVTMDSKRAVDFLALDPALQKIAVENLTCNVIERSYISILRKQENGNLAYDSVLRESTVHTETVSIGASGLHYALPTGAPGNFVIELRDEAGLRVSKLEFTVVGHGAVSRSLERNAELEIKLAKPQYNAGDTIELSIVAPYIGSGLITIERDKVYAHTWFKTDAASSIQRIRVPADFEGTGYINVAFVRGLDSREVFMSPLSYGVVPFQANIERRRLPVELRAAKTVRPGEPLKIFYKTDRPAKIAVFAVDEGILQVTNYGLPNPLAYFFRKCALEVETAQIMDLLIPEFSVWRAASAFGGDDGHLNPFKRVTEKPVVFWSGIIDADSTEREVTYNVPDFFDGSLKLMAVAVSPDAVDSVEKKCLVRGPFVITPSVPTVAAPGDVFDVGVTVANGVEGSGENANVMLQAIPSAHLEIVKSPANPLKISEGREQTVSFTIRALDKLGAASLAFRASSGSETATRRSTLSVRPPVPMVTEIHSGIFTKSDIVLPVTRLMHPEFRKLEASVSALPLGLARGLDVFLKNFPHGCSEQITSAAFCRLLLSDEADFSLPRAEVNAQMEKTFATLGRRQNDKGAFGLWSPEESDGIDFVSVYVTHFLSEAKAAGFAPPAEMFARGLRHLQEMAGKHEPKTLCEARTVAYAIYVLTREGVITTNYEINLRDTLDKHFENKWQSDLAGVYLAGAYAILKKQNDAQKLIRAYTLGTHAPDPEWDDFFQPLSADAQYVAILARHFPELLSKISPADFQAIVRSVSDGNFNTLSAAYSVWALKSYSQFAACQPLDLGIAELSRDKKTTPLATEGAGIKRAAFTDASASLRFSMKAQAQGLGAFFQIVEAGYDLRLPTQPVNSGLEIWREFTGENAQATQRVSLGNPVTVRLRVRNLSRRAVSNIAVVDLLPGGFEIVSGSYSDSGWDHVEPREDRVVFFGNVAPNSVREITYRIKPTNRGEFVVPPPFCESMYDRAIHASGVSGKIKVVDAQ